MKYHPASKVTPYLQALESLLLSDANVLLLERHWTEAVVEEEEALAWVHAEELSDILIVGESSAEAHKTNLILRLLNLAQGTRHDGLQNRTAIVVQQVNLVNNDERDEKGAGALSFASDNIPLLWCADNDLRGKKRGEGN